MSHVPHVAQQGLQVSSRQVLLQGYQGLLAWLQGTQCKGCMPRTGLQQRLSGAALCSQALPVQS
jgi:hypothetical protein